MGPGVALALPRDLLPTPQAVTSSGHHVMGTALSTRAPAPLRGAGKAPAAPSEPPAAPHAGCEPWLPSEGSGCRYPPPFVPGALSTRAPGAGRLSAPHAGREESSPAGGVLGQDPSGAGHNTPIPFLAEPPASRPRASAYSLTSCTPRPAPLHPTPGARELGLGVKRPGLQLLSPSPGRASHRRGRDKRQRVQNKTTKK